MPDTITVGEARAQEAKLWAYCAACDAGRYAPLPAADAGREGEEVVELHRRGLWRCRTCRRPPSRLRVYVSLFGNPREVVVSSLT